MKKWYNKNIEPPTNHTAYLCFLEDMSVRMCKYVNKKWVEIWFNIEQPVIYWTYYPLGINGKEIMRDKAIRRYKLDKLNNSNEIENKR